MKYHDAHLAKQHAKSEQVRIAHGWLTPEEIKAQQESEERRRLEQAAKAALGQPLFEEER